VLAARVYSGSLEREVANPGEERKVEQLGELRPDLAGVGVDRVPTGEYEVNGPSRVSVAASVCGRQRVRAAGTGSSRGRRRCRQSSSPPRSPRATSLRRGRTSVKTVHVSPVLGRGSTALLLRGGNTGSSRACRRVPPARQVELHLLGAGICFATRDAHRTLP
jgi:hypothetical protein